TRFSRDWSSDVCSSDLSVRLLDLFLDDLTDVVQQPGAACLGGIKAQLGGHERADARRLDGVGEQVLAVAGAVLHAPDEADQLGRSEERRVGKECESRRR